MILQWRKKSQMKEFSDAMGSSVKEVSGEKGFWWKGTFMNEVFNEKWSPMKGISGERDFWWKGVSNEKGSPMKERGLR